MVHADHYRVEIEPNKRRGWYDTVFRLGDHAKHVTLTLAEIRSIGDQLLLYAQAEEDANQETETPTIW